MWIMKSSFDSLRIKKYWRQETIPKASQLENRTSLLVVNFPIVLRY